MFGREVSKSKYGQGSLSKICYDLNGEGKIRK
jgi:hypothetical protein